MSPSARTPGALLLLLTLAACRHTPPALPAAPRAATTTATTTATATIAITVPEGRLPSGVRPLAYDLALIVDPRRSTLSGRARVRLALDAPRTQLFLHGRALTMEHVRLVLADGTTVGARYREVSPVGVALIELERAAPAGEATLELAWSAPIAQDSQDGAFRVEAGGERYVFTQLEATLARRVFPCFDEPTFKAPLTLTLDVPAGDVALANTPERHGRAAIGVDPGPAPAAGMRRVRFAPTPPLPTYLLAFAVGPLDVVVAPDVAPNEVRTTPLPLRGVTVKGRGANLTYALHAAAAAVTVLERYFGIALPFDKLDLVAIPGFTGAMENVGLVTFAEGLLYLDPERTPREHLRGALSTIAHEVAHQWVGNLATMPWWDDLWLNEAFASWIEGPAVAGWAPELDPGLDRLESGFEAMDLDRLVSARRIRQAVESHDDVMNAFDEITYSKGAAVLGMFEHWLGTPTFRAGVHAWLDTHRFQSSTAVDFMRALSAAAKRDVATPMSTFLDQAGVPLLDVTVRCDGARAEAVVTQSRELPVGSRGARAVRWQLPWCWERSLGSGGTRQETDCTLLTEPTQVVPLGDSGCPVWLHPNADGKGYHRFQVAQGAWRTLVEATLKRPARDAQLSVADSLGAAFTAARVPAADALVLLAPFAASKVHVVAAAPRATLETTRTRLLPPELRPRFEAWVRAIYRGARPKVVDAAARPASADARELQATVLEVLAQIGRDREVRAALVRAGEAYLSIGGDGAVHAQAVAPDSVALALSVAADDGSDATWAALVATLRRSSDPALHRTLLHALGSATSPARADAARALMLELRDDDLITMLRAHTSRSENAEATWAWLKVHLAELAPRVSEEYQLTLAEAPAGLCTKARAEELRGEAGRPLAALPGGPRVLAATLESVELCAALVEAQSASARAFAERLP